NDAGKENKVLCTTMGAATDLQNEGLRRLIVNAAYWGLGLEVPAKADVAYVDEFKPLTYGFNGYRHGIKPEDHALGKVLREGDPAPAKAEPKKKQGKAEATITRTTVSAGAEAAHAGPLTLKKDEHVAIIGNVLADRIQFDGWLETLIHARFPNEHLVFRNLSASGDEVATWHRSQDFGSRDSWLTKAKADVILAFYGYNESFKGPDGLSGFKDDLDKFLKATAAQKYNGTSAPRIVLFGPAADEKTQDPNLPDPAKVNANLELYSAAMAEVAKANGVQFIDLLGLSKEIYARAAKAGKS